MRAGGELVELFVLFGFGAEGGSAARFGVEAEGELVRCSGVGEGEAGPLSCGAREARLLECFAVRVGEGLGVGAEAAEVGLAAGEGLGALGASGALGVLADEAALGVESELCLARARLARGGFSRGDGERVLRGVEGALAQLEERAERAFVHASSASL